MKDSNISELIVDKNTKFRDARYFRGDSIYDGDEWSTHFVRMDYRRYGAAIHLFHATIAGTQILIILDLWHR